MAYNYREWKLRMSNRSDMSSSLVHLTRPSGEHTSVEVLLKILREQTILGSDPQKGFIHGGESATCFQDAPLYSVAQNIAFEKKYREENNSRLRYSGCGLVFSKYYVFQRGGRPVIYDIPAQAREYLSEESWYRIVSLDISNMDQVFDWSHEREWRVKGNLAFEINNCAILLETKADYRELMQKVDSLDNKNIVDRVCGITVLDSLLM